MWSIWEGHGYFYAAAAVGWVLRKDSTSVILSFLCTRCKGKEFTFVCQPKIFCLPMYYGNFFTCILPFFLQNLFHRAYRMKIDCLVAKILSVCCARLSLWWVFCKCCFSGRIFNLSTKTLHSAMKAKPHLPWEPNPWELVLAGYNRGRQ